MSFLSQLTKAEQTRLLEEVNYMNLEEIRGFCSERGIPYRVVAEYSNGKVKTTQVEGAGTGSSTGAGGAGRTR